ncbi:2-dehydropantoate 2-reductase [Salirhabdus sp. Marseille-P4669]|uniref:2-dehydropantoate 2-reductase n=1 Tax=Salirhabdus sp. Marseille-P4669 TaxID=2042310 RepID=UPI001357CAAE|nr:2-dehydropantoate 2-reductase [Salirhabdus sp. Marseille-P4669]
MNIGIIGLGSTGLLLSAFLRKQGHTITCYVRREEQKESLNKNGIYLLPYQHTSYIKAEDISNIQEHDLYIICVKQPQLFAVLDQLEKALSPHIPILFLQNGMSHIDRAQTLINPIFIGVLDHGAKRVNDYTVEHTGKGIIRIGSIKDEYFQLLENMVDCLSSDAFPIYVEKDWEQILRHKLIVNAVINPLTAILNVRNGEIVSNVHIHRLAYAICQEACDVLDMDPVLMWRKVLDVVERTSKNMSSMLQDIRLQKETEIDSITGYLLSKAKTGMPNTEFVYHAIKAKELGGVEDD